MRNTLFNHLSRAASAQSRPRVSTNYRSTPITLSRTYAVSATLAEDTGVLPSVSKLSPGQAAYHFLAGYQDGNFVRACSKAPSAIEPLVLAKAFYSQLKDNNIPSFLINVNDGGKHATGKDICKRAVSTLSGKLPESKPGVTDSKVAELKGKYESFLSGKFKELPEESSF